MSPDSLANDIFLKFLLEYSLGYSAFSVLQAQWHLFLASHRVVAIQHNLATGFLYLLSNLHLESFQLRFSISKTSNTEDLTSLA